LVASSVTRHLVASSMRKFVASVWTEGRRCIRIWNRIPLSKKYSHTGLPCAYVCMSQMISFLEAFSPNSAYKPSVFHARYTPRHLSSPLYSHEQQQVKCTTCSRLPYKIKKYKKNLDDTNPHLIH
jgi:hypothetical protein